MLSALSPARRRLVLALAGGVLAAAVAGAVVVAVGANGSPAVAQDRPGPVLLVPGYGGSVSALTPLVQRLRAAGKVVQVVALPDQARGDLDAQATVLADAARQLRERTHAPSVDVVGYSAGGVVARLWLRDHGGARLARRVVALGAPQHGTLLAEAGTLVPSTCPLACQQLAPDSAVLRALNAGSEVPAGPRFFAIWTTHDDVVLPPDSARLAGAVNTTVQSICPTDPVEHSGLPADPVVQELVVADLAPRPLPVPPGCPTR